MRAWATQRAMCFLNNYEPDALAAAGYGQGFHTSVASSPSLTISFRGFYYGGNGGGVFLFDCPLYDAVHPVYVWVSLRFTVEGPSLSRILVYVHAGSVDNH